MTPLRPLSIPLAPHVRVAASLLAPPGTPTGLYGYGPLTVLLSPLALPSWLPAPERRRRYAGPFPALAGAELDVDGAFDALVRELHSEGVLWAASVRVYLDDPMYTGRVALAFLGRRLVGIVAPRRVTVAVGGSGQ